MLLVAWGGYLARLGMQLAVAQQGRTPALDPREYRATSTLPKPQAALPPPLALQTTLRKDPPSGFELWIFSSAGAGAMHWPYGRMNKTGKGRSWTGTYDAPLGFQDGEARLLRLFLVGRNGQALLRCYTDLNHELTPAGSGWRGLSEADFTDDIVEVAAVPIVLRHGGDAR